MHDTTPVATAITRLIAAGLAEPMLLAVIAQQFPDLKPAELLQALQVAQAAAERRALRPH
jgi:hypothetical protein